MKTSLLPWQDTQWQKIAAQSSKNVLPHAYLFNGVEGIGKGRFAHFLAAWLLCESRINAGSDAPCGQCKQCKLVEADTHSDLKFIEPEEGSRVIKVDAIRALTEFVSQSSNQGGLKIAIINPAEALNINASNALLKTLEEPSPNSIILLVSHVSGQLLPTIRSRCQMVDFVKPSAEQASEWLADNVPADERLPDLLALAGGAPLEALKLKEINALDEHDQMLSELGAVLKREVSPSYISERWGDDMANIRLGWMLQWLELITKSKLAEAALPAANQKMFKYISGKSSAERLFALYDESLAQQRLLTGTSNPNKVLLFEHLFQQWIELIRN